MTKDELKIMLYHFREIQAQVIYLCSILSENNKEHDTYRKKVETYTLLKGALTILDERERFVVENHLIYHDTWPAVSAKMSNNFDADYIRSDRTLRRIQKQALEKMLIFIEEVSIQ